jgi:hypothetical protein
MVLPDSHRISLTPRYLETYSKELYYFHLRDYHPLWLNFPEYSVNNIIFYSSAYQQFGPNMPHDTANTTVASFNMLDGLGFFPFARRYSGNHYCFLFLRVLRCFSSPGCLHIPYVFRYGCCNITRSGLPHSEIFGSQVISTYPKLIAGSRVLHQLLVPRHPPCALSNLTKIFMHR